MDIYGNRGLDSKGAGLCVSEGACVCCCMPACMHLIASKCKGRAERDAFLLEVHKGWPHGNTAMNLFETEGI